MTLLCNIFQHMIQVACDAKLLLKIRSLCKDTLNLVTSLTEVQMIGTNTAHIFHLLPNLKVVSGCFTHTKLCIPFKVNEVDIEIPKKELYSRTDWGLQFRPEYMLDIIQEYIDQVEEQEHTRLYCGDKFITYDSTENGFRFEANFTIDSNQFLKLIPYIGEGSEIVIKPGVSIFNSLKSNVLRTPYLFTFDMSEFYPDHTMGQQYTPILSKYVLGVKFINSSHIKGFKETWSNKERIQIIS